MPNKYLKSSVTIILTGLSQAARGTASQSPSEGQEDGQREMSPFDKLATKLGLPTNCDIDLRKQEELEVTDEYLCLDDILICFLFECWWSKSQVILCKKVLKNM